MKNNPIIFTEPVKRFPDEIMRVEMTPETLGVYKHIVVAIHDKKPRILRYTKVKIKNDNSELFKSDFFDTKDLWAFAIIDDLFDRPLNTVVSKLQITTYDSKEDALKFALNKGSWTVLGFKTVKDVINWYANLK